MIKRSQLILPAGFRTRQPTGVLDTPAKIHRAAESWREKVDPAMERIRINRLRSLELSTRRYIG